MSIADIRRSYEKHTLDEEALAGSPFEQFETWFNEALAGDIVDPTAMTLATVGRDGRPSARMVLLKGFDSQGFVFFSNYESDKARQMAENPYASLSFYWPGLERQVRIEGHVEKASAEESDHYYFSRPLGSRIGAWASPQSRAISREQLEARAASFAESLGENPPRPPYWGGYRVVPRRIEFWQGRTSRLHDRFVFQLNAQQQWEHGRIAP